MSTSTCPVCHGPVSPADDICENCGAVLSTVSLPPVMHNASAPIRSALQVTLYAQIASSQSFQEKTSANIVEQC